ncbi:uncharacterized protein LOC101736495 [Bombyx mori]
MTYHSETSAKAIFASEVVSNIYNSFEQWYFTIAFCEFSYMENRIIKYTENYGNGNPVMLVNTCPRNDRAKFKPKYNIHGQTVYIITSENLRLEDSEQAVESLKRTGVFQPRSAVIFVVNIPVEIDSYFFYNVKMHFQLLWSRSITNSVLMVWSHKLRAYSYNPFFDEIRDITNVSDVSGFLDSQYKNLFGHELRLSVYRTIYLDDEIGPIRCHKNYLAKTVIDKLNATCKSLVPRDGSTVGDLLDNGTATGATSDLIDGYSDMELNSRILKNSFYGYIDTTYPLTQDELCFIVKKSDKQSTFTTVLNLLTSELLISLICFAICFVGIALIVRKIEKTLMKIEDKKTVGSVMIDILKCFLRQTAEIKFFGPVFRCITLAIVIYSLIINSVIDAILTSAITYPRYKPNLNTMNDLVKSNLTLGVHNRDFGIFNSSLNSEYYESLKNRIEIFSDKQIKKFIDERQFQYAVLLRRTEAENIVRKPANMKNGRKLFHIVAECPVPCSMVFCLRYGSPFKPILESILHRLSQYGVLKHWTDTEEYNYNRNTLNAENKERKSLSISNVYEVFLVTLGGFLISTIVFIIEVFLHAFDRYSQLQKKGN